MRALVVLLAATLKLTVPLPVPEAPLFMGMKPSLLTADQAQPACVVTLTVPLPPAETKFCEVGEMEKLQVEPACVTVWTNPPIMMLPIRVLEDGLAATLYLTF